MLATQELGAVVGEALELVPHPDFESRDVVLMDYPMEDGVLKVRVRAANAGYMLQQSSCGEWSPDRITL